MQLEQTLLTMEGLATTVVRPAWVYGGNWGNYLAGWFKGNDKGEIVRIWQLDEALVVDPHR